MQDSSREESKLDTHTHSHSHSSHTGGDNTPTSTQHKTLNPERSVSSLSANPSSLSHSVSVLAAAAKRRKRKAKLFADNLESLINNDRFADVRFLVGDGDDQQEFTAVRAVLAVRSPVFDAMLFGKFQEANDKETEIEVPDVSPRAFRQMLRWIFTDHCSLRDDSVMEILYAAQKYGVDGLRDQCVKYVKAYISVDNVCGFLSVGKPVDEKLNSLCFGLIEMNADAVLQSGTFHLLSKRNLKQIVSSDYFGCSHEIQLFTECVRWAEEECKRQKTVCTPKKLRELLGDVIPHMRFILMSQRDIILKVYPTKLLDADVCMDFLSYLSSAQLPEGDTDLPEGGRNLDSLIPESVAKFPCVPRRGHCKIFTYESNFDENGVVYYLGTRKGTKAFQNPHILGEVVMSASSIQNGSVQNVLGRQALQTYTSNDPGQWMMLDLGEKRRLTPSHYTLRHGFNCANYLPRNWVLEASIDDDDEWIVLSEHKEDSSLTSAFQAHSWPITLPKTALAHGQLPTHRYRRFRVRSTGPTSSMEYHYLMISGLELYGTLFMKSFRDFVL